MTDPQRPRLLDLFSGAGGAAVGYARAGFDVVGVDLMPQPRYPYPFVLANALELELDFVRSFDAVHASPPCKLYTRARAKLVHELYLFEPHADAIAPARRLLEAAGVPYVIENVVGAPVRADVELCGTMFGLGYEGFELRRHRIFELGGWRPSRRRPRPCRHNPRKRAMPVYGHSIDADFRRRYRRHRDFEGVLRPSAREEAMGIDWMVRTELAEAIPPAFTEWLGGELLAALGLVEAAA